MAVPDDDQLGELAPILGLRHVDLLAIAGSRIPGEVLPTDPEAFRPVEEVVGQAPSWTDAGQMDQILNHARSQPATGHVTVPADLPALGAVTFGGAFTRLMAVRRLTRRSLAYATGFAQSTVNVTMADVRVPTPDRLACFAAALAIPADDLEAMAGRPTGPPSTPPDAAVQPAILAATAVVGELVLALVPLSAARIDAVAAFVRSLQRPDDRSR